MSYDEVLLIYWHLNEKIAHDAPWITPHRDVMNFLWIIQTIIFIGKKL